MALKAAPGFSLKDDMFNADTTQVLSDSLRQAWPAFDSKQFMRGALTGFKTRELKARVDWLVELLAVQLPPSIEEALAILEQALPPPLDPTRSDGDFGRFIWGVPGEYAARFACNKPHLTLAFSFLEQTTMRFSAENAIRPFLNKYPRETLRFMARCAKHQNYHVRRLASEGTRPLLPWSARVNLASDEVAKILNQLHADKTRYVTRSVANHLNDISKSDPKRVLATASQWKEENRQQPDELAWMTRHALRTLRKRSEPATLKLLGYRAKPAVEFHPGEASRQVRPGENFEWRCIIESRAKQQLAIHLRIHFLKNNGTHSVTVFKIKDAGFAKGERLDIVKRQRFRPMTTRTLYPGIHYADIDVNGTVIATTKFELLGS